MNPQQGGVINNMYSSHKTVMSLWTGNTVAVVITIAVHVTHETDTWNPTSSGSFSGCCQNALWELHEEIAVD